MQIVVIVRPDAAKALHGAGTRGVRDSLGEAVSRLGFHLEPMHPGVADPSLQKYFVIEVGDRAAAERVTSALRQHPAVEGIYLKPPDAAP